jgi:hypothetical protein
MAPLAKTSLRFFDIGTSNARLDPSNRARATATIKEAPAEGGTATGANERKGENSYRRLLKWLSSYCLLVVKPGHAASKSSCNQSDNGECRKDAHGLAPYFLGLI